MTIPSVTVGQGLQASKQVRLVNTVTPSYRHLCLRQHSIQHYL